VRGGRATFAPKCAKSLRAQDGRINHAAVAVEAQNTIAPKDLRVEDIKCLDIKDITAPVKSDMDVMNQNLLNIVGERHPMLMAAAEQIFGAGGKKLRPMLIFLVSHGTAQLGGLT
jgi:all-trans-nonaprenyl-diphosphate synthase